MMFVDIFYSELFISELPDNKKIKTYARQKPIRLKRHLTVGVEYEDLFTNGMIINPVFVVVIGSVLCYTIMFCSRPSFTFN